MKFRYRACKPSASLAISALSCPAKAGHPVITDNLVVTGSPAFAGDDDGEATDRTKNHDALDAHEPAPSRRLGRRAQILREEGERPAPGEIGRRFVVARG